MLIAKEVNISKPIEEVWEVLGNQFGQIDKWASLISESKVSGEPTVSGLDYTYRTTQTTQGLTKQQMRSFNPKEHSLSYSAVSGTPFFIKSAVAEWKLTDKGESNTRLNLELEVETKGIMGVLLKPVAKKKLGNLGDVLVDDLKFYVENGTPHARKVEADKK